MFEQGQNKRFYGINGDRTNLTLLILILGILSLVSIGIMVLAMLRQMYPKVFAAPGINKQLNYQGKLQDADGITVPDGSYAIKFTIYDAATGGNILWTARETDTCGAPFNPTAKSISVYNGVFSTLLGESGDCPITLDFNDDAYYLGVTVGTDPEMTPRKRIGAAGYAFNADLLDGLNTSNSGGSGAFVPVTDSSGNLVLSKDFTVDSGVLFVDSTNNRVGVNNIAPTYTLDVTSSEVGGRAVFGQATDNSATANYGGYFTAAGGGSSYFSASAGVYGTATNTGSVYNYGGYFTSAGSSDGAAGVFGYASDTGNVANTGGIFVSQGQKGRGVYGLAFNSGNYTTIGVKGEANSYGAGTAGVFGTVNGNGDDLYGVYGLADESGSYKNFGGYFIAKGTGAGTAGVYGASTAVGGWGIPYYGGYFTSAGDYGVGVYGEATATSFATNYGVYGKSDGDTGVGVRGLASGTGGANYGGYFWANGPGGYGVYGRANDTSFSQNYGGDFLARGQTGIGVRGTADNSSAAANYGGYFEAAGTNGATGVYGSATGASGTNYGVRGAVTSSTGWAGYFTGGYGVHADNDLYIGATSETIDNTGFTMDGSGAGFFADEVGAEGSIYTDTSFIVGSSTTYGNNTITTSSGDLTVTPAGGELSVVGNIESLANTSFNPILKGSVGTGTYPRSVYVSGRYAFLITSFGNTLEIFDVFNPTSPSLVSSTTTGSFPMSVYISGRYAYVANYSGNTLQIFDISNPASPSNVSTTATLGTSPISVYVSGHYAYVVTYNSGTLDIFDVANPSNPVLISSTSTSGANPYTIYVFGRYAYIVENAGNKLEIFDISDPANPSSTGSVTTDSGPISVYVSGRYAYVVNGNANTLQIFDVSDPSNPTSVGSAATGTFPINVFVSGRYAYVVNQSSDTLQIFDVSNPTSPVNVGSATTGSTPNALYVSGRYAYVGNASANTLQIFDVSGLETTSAMVHSLEAGNLQVKNDIIAQGEIQTKGGINTLGSGFFGEGVAALTAESSGRAVYGHATATNAGAVGGYFVSDAAAGAAVIGRANSTDGLNFGGDFRAEGPGGYGVRGISASTSNTAVGYGVYGETYSEWGYGVAGVSVPIFPNTAGIGVYGYTTGTATGSAGVKGVASGTGAYGVYGEAIDSFSPNYGGYFKSYGQNGGAGVYGTASYNSNWAGYFTGGAGLYADRLSVAETSTSVAYNTIGPAGASHTGVGEIENSSDLFIADDLEVNGYTWLDGGHTDLAEMINYNGQGEAGDVIVIDESEDNTAKLATKPYDQNVIGVISTKPSLVITGNIKEGKLLAVAGRVPTKVTNINGPIARGDLLTTSAVPGHAMKATEPGPIVGKALEPCNQTSCTIWVFLNVGWYGGVSPNISTASSNGNSSQSVVYQTVALDKLTADLDANGYAINNISKIVSKDEVWSIDEKGLLKIKIKFERDKETAEKEIYSLSSTDVEVILSGSSKLENGQALVDFSQIDQDFIEIIDQTVPIKISVTPTEQCQGMYVAEKYPQGFKVKELNGGTSNAAFDWIVIGRRKGY